MKLFLCSHFSVFVRSIVVSLSMLCFCVDEVRSHSVDYFLSGMCSTISLIEQQRAVQSLSSVFVSTGRLCRSRCIVLLLIPSCLISSYVDVVYLLLSVFQKGAQEIIVTPFKAEKENAHGSAQQATINPNILFSDMQQMRCPLIRYSAVRRLQSFAVSA